MPYDPRMMAQMTRMGMGMLAPQQPVFATDPDPNRNRPTAAPQWWEQPLPPRRGQSADQSDDPSQAPGAPKRPPSMFDMMMGLGSMTRPQYDKAISGPGNYGIAPQDAARVSPWAFLGSLGSGKG